VKQTVGGVDQVILMVAMFFFPLNGWVRKKDAQYMQGFPKQI